MRTATINATPSNSNDEVTTHSRIDGEPVHWGSGWISGVFGIAFGLIGLGAVLCLHFPDLLTMPQLRSAYPVALVRAIVHLLLVTSFLLGIASLCLRRKKTLGIVAISFPIIAALLGGATIPIHDSTTPEGPFLGLDWFLLNLIFWCAIFIPLERMFALRREQPVFRRGWRTDLTYFFISSLAIQITTFLTMKPVEALFSWIVSSPWRQAIASQPVLFQLLEVLLLTDFVQYWVHRAFHRIPWLWRFHEIHHSAEAMDWLAGSRLHIVDVVLTRGLTYIPLFALGFSDLALLLYAVVVTLQATLIHANVRFRFGPLRYALATPQFHHWHHSSEPEAIDKNFAVHLPIWDMLFGSFHLPGERWPSRYGVLGKTVPDGYLRQLVYPFRTANQAANEAADTDSDGRSET